MKDHAKQQGNASKQIEAMIVPGRSPIGRGPTGIWRSVFVPRLGVGPQHGMISHLIVLVPISTHIKRQHR
jgi:hypothetical protein